MKKWLVIAALCGGLYIYLAHTESGKKHYIQLTEWLQQRIGQKVPDFTQGDDKTTIYKIQNPDGTWTYSNEKPKDSTKAVEQEYRSDTNVLPSPANNAPDRKN
jgi:hypothetical protein